MGATADCTRHYAHVEGTELHWIEVGAGRPMVLLHGLADCHRTWRRLIPALADRRRLLMPDLAGHGLSARPDASYSLEWHASLVGAWMDRLGLDEVDLVGHSYGGGVAQWLVLQRASRIRRLGLVAPGGLGRGVGIGVRLATLGIVEKFGQPFMGLGTSIGLRAAGMFERDDIDHVRWMNTAPGTARALRRTAADVVDLKGQRIHMLEHAHEVAEMPPTLLFWGDRDPIIPFEQAERMRASFDGVSLVRFEGVGHFPHLERPDEMANAMRDFVDEAALCRPKLRRPLLVAGGIDKPGKVKRFLRAVGNGIRRIIGMQRLAA